MNTFITVLGALLVRDVLMEVYLVLRLKRTKRLLLDAFDQGTYLRDEVDVASVEEFLKSKTANTNRTKKD